MYYVMRASAPSLHRESTDSLIHQIYNVMYDNTLVITQTSTSSYLNHLHLQYIIYTTYFIYIHHLHYLHYLTAVLNARARTFSCIE